MDNNNNLYSKDDKFSVPNTQESPATFSRNIIKRLGIHRSSSGTDAINSNTSLNTMYCGGEPELTVYQQHNYDVSGVLFQLHWVKL